MGDGLNMYRVMWTKHITHAAITTGCTTNHPGHETPIIQTPNPQHHISHT